MHTVDFAEFYQFGLLARYLCGMVKLLRVPNLIWKRDLMELPVPTLTP